ncbi:MAG: Asp-tRNA(Asn)/Glu-tRNA(Gln) amidotransferase subunit GatA [Thermodesulfobacteriota bacterium]|nr:Asp-tRNA(Asn)/Glu-tRNA(Gln) amidotransferase subunit GatA [Thermodesulfobacteriota bacterium]
MELCDRNISELAEMLRRGDVSSKEITESVFARISEKEDTINAYITTTYDSAMKQADMADKRFRKGGDIPLLNGIPIAVKDIICTKGIPTTCGSKILSDFVPTYNATAVEKLLGDGAVIVGKANMDEFGMGSSTENSVAGPTRNPLNTECVAGGSSGGSAAAVAAGEAIGAVGTDTGGSIRQPAAYCGVVGIKPTYGRVSRYGLISYASSLDQIGAIGKTVRDCAVLMDSMAGHDPLDTTSAQVKKPGFLNSLNKEIQGLRIGLPKEYFVEGLDPNIKERIETAVSLLEEKGAHVVEISLPHASYAVSSYYLIATAEASSNLARYDGVKYGYRSEAVSDAVTMYETTRRIGFGREVKRRIMLGSYVLSAGYYDAYYLKAQKARTLIKEDFDRAFEKVDAIVTPVSPCLPFKLGEKLEDPLRMYLVDIYTVSLNLSGLPGMSVNCGTVEGLPVGMQIIGRAFDEATVFQVGHAFEESTGSK